MILYYPGEDRVARPAEGETLDGFLEARERLQDGFNYHLGRMLASKNSRLSSVLDNLRGQLHNQRVILNCLKDFHEGTIESFDTPIHWSEENPAISTGITNRNAKEYSKSILEGKQCLK